MTRVAVCRCVGSVRAELQRVMGWRSTVQAGISSGTDWNSEGHLGSQSDSSSTVQLLNLVTEQGQFPVL